MVNRRLKATVAAVTVMFAVLAIACGSSDSGMTRAEVEAIARAEAAKAPAAEPGLTREEVAEIAQAAVVTAAADTLTYEDVQTIVRDSMSDMAAMTPGNGGLTSADVDAMIQAAVSDIPPPVPSFPGLTAADVERIVRSEIAGIPQPDPGLSREDVEEIARAAVPGVPPALPPGPGLSRAEVAEIAHSVVASIPPKSNPAEFTRYFVDTAISRYDALELDATIAHYNSTDSVDGQWYVFIIDESGDLIGHYDPSIVGQNLKGPLGTDATGYTFGTDMLSATRTASGSPTYSKTPHPASLSPSTPGSSGTTDSSLVPGGTPSPPSTPGSSLTTLYPGTSPTGPKPPSRTTVTPAVLTDSGTYSSSTRTAT